MRRFESINVIPFIDIMLVLLAIVLTTATFVVSSKLDINVPKSSSEEAVSNNKVVEIAIDEKSSFYLNDNEIKTEELKQKLSVLEKSTPINLRVDSKVDFGHFIEIIDLLKQFNLDKFSIITKKNN